MDSLWLAKNVVDEGIVQYGIASGTFSAESAPFCTNCALQKMAAIHREPNRWAAVGGSIGDFCADDFLGSFREADSRETLCGLAGFQGMAAPTLGTGCLTILGS